MYLVQIPFSQIIHREAIDEFYFSLENFQIEWEEAQKIKTEIAKKFDLDSLFNKKTSHLSHGECQKLLLASLLTLNPKVLLFDEPTAFLDSQERKNFYELLEELKQVHLIVMIDHHIHEIIDKVDFLITVNEQGEVSLQKKVFVPEFKMLQTFHMPELKKSPNTAIQIENLRFAYEKYRPLINIKYAALHSGEVIIIQGKNGTGKSTLLKLISGFIKKKQGEITIGLEGVEVPTKKIPEQIGFIFQNPESCFLFDTLKEELGGEDFGFTKRELDRSTHLFSEGEKRRISIFIALAQNKNILLYDEPTFGQDKNNIKMLTDIILHLKNKNKLQIIISHDEEFIKAVGDRTLLLKDPHPNG